MNTELTKKAEELKRSILAAQETLARLENAASEQTTYDDVVKKLQPQRFFSGDGVIVKISTNMYAYASEAIAKRNAIRAKYENIAFYLNGCEQELLRVMDSKWFNTITSGAEIITGNHDAWYNPCLVYFISKKAAKEALRILTEDEFRKM
jgi:hypothetical protein